MIATGTRPVDDTFELVRSILDGPSDGTLPSLTREELLTLSDDPVLGHGADAQWWRQLDGVGRELVMQTAQRGLIARNLLVAGSDGSSLDVDARVRLVLRARRLPSFLVVVGEPAADLQLTGYGIALVAGEHTGVLLTARLEGIYLNRLLGPAEAADTLADWLLRRPLDGRSVGRTIEVIRPAAEPGGPAGPVDGVSGRRAIVFGDGSSWVLSDIDESDGQPRDPRPADLGTVCDWITGRLSSGRTSPGGT